MLYVFTSCALNFVPCAKLLAASVREHMPDARFVLTLTDDKPTDFRLEDEGFDEVFYLEDFSDQLENPRAWAFGHTIMELATAVKPFTASKLMEREDCDAVMFFDPDCMLFDSMEEMRAALEENSVVLTPHASKLHENKKWLFFEMNPLKVGGFNLGFFGFKNDETGRAVSSWWRYRLKDLCLIDPARGLFTDQKWMDLLPNYIESLKVMREPVYNIARWNTFQRNISKQDDRYYADGKPIQFIHFSGFYKIGPYVQGLYDRSSEPLIEDLGPLQELSLAYAEKLDAARSHSDYTAPWKLGYYQNGEEITEADRRRHKGSRDLQTRYPDPFSTVMLDSYWLYCRKQSRIEEETYISQRVPSHSVVNRGVQAHNSMLRKLNDALEKQLQQTTTELIEARAHQTRFEAAYNELKATILSRWSPAQGHSCLDALAQAAIELGFSNDAYLEKHPDVAESGQGAMTHFLTFGIAENREPELIDRLVRYHSALLLELVGPETALEKIA